VEAESGCDGRCGRGRCVGEERVWRWRMRALWQCRGAEGERGGEAMGVGRMRALCRGRKGVAVVNEPLWQCRGAEGERGGVGSVAVRKG